MAGRRDDRSAEAAEYRRWYNTARWRRRRLAQLEASPVCEFCLKRGIVNDGSRKMDGSVQTNPRRRFLVADHIVAHRGDPELFWSGALQTLCPDHHDSVKQAEEVRGYSTEVGIDGWPVDPRHPSAG
jgi:hypothetical protein